MDDIKDVFRKGNMLSRLIIVNIIVFVLLVLIKLILPSFFLSFFPFITLSSEILEVLVKPWTILSYSFVHLDLYPLIFNMLVYYWFGNIVGDLMGDKRIFPLYIIGALGGFIAYMILQVVGVQPGTLHGASPAVMATVMAATVISPNYMVNLILVGRTPIKYITIAYILMDLVMISNSANIGGQASRLGGLILGGLFVYFLKRGVDFSLPITRVIDLVLGIIIPSKRKSKLVLKHRNSQSTTNKKRNPKINQKEVDEILEKIKKKGYDSLNKEEKEALFMASKSNKDS